jgi:predicted methyltransferase
MMVLLSAAQASAILGQLERGAEARTSLDLGRTEATVALEGSLVRLSTEARISLEDLRRIVKNDDSVFSVQGEAVEKLIRYSEATRRSYKLRPTADWPALEISGILMHRIRGTTPRLDAQAKLRLVAPVLGAVLDTCMGLGYTAMLAAETAIAVTAIEKDENVVEMARANPHSQPLFSHPRIKLIQGDATAVVAGLADESFNLVNHDPPTLSVAGELYSDAFYGQLLRVLKPAGKLLHYTGAPGSKARGVDLGASVARRLGKLGFARVRSDAGTGCVLAVRRG